MAAKSPSESIAADDRPAAPLRGDAHARRGERGARHHARALALQGLYGWLLAGGDAQAIAAQLLTEEQRARVDIAFFEETLARTIAAADELRAEFAALVDRPVAALSPIEHGVLIIGAFELKYRPEIPYRVCISEAIELAKSFGGTDGFRYVNGVLDKLAQRLRGTEMEMARGAPAR
jgi:N utilization substance protein B